MAATTVYHGLNLNWGTLASGSCSAFGAFKMQSANATRTGDELEVRDEVGDQVAWVGYGLKRTGTFTYYATSNTTASAADGTVTVTAPTYGQICTVSSAKFDFLTGSYICKDVTITTSNTDANKVDVALTAYPNITS